MSKDTMRVLLGWDCNLNCGYCCNQIPSVREAIKTGYLYELDFSPYHCICISGGEPLLYPALLIRLMYMLPKNKRVVLYTNGLLLTKDWALALQRLGLTNISIGLHQRETFNQLVAKGCSIASATGLGVRFCLEDTHTDYLRNLRVLGANVEFKFWHRDDCDRDNEDRVVLL